MKDYASIWTNGNNAGDGFPVGEENSDIDKIEEVGTLIISSTNNDGYAVYRDKSGAEIIVADANGPWAVAV